MCGMIGIAGKTKSGLWKHDCQVFTDMLFADQLRGTDGTGMIYNTSKGVHTEKMPTDATTFMNTKEYDEIMDAASKTGHFLLGHNRAATRGNHVWKNTHPFKEGNIILMHNGTLYRHDNLNKESEVDSHAICKHMSIHGAEKTLSEIDGAFALIWVDLEKLTINLARNYERPLSITETASSWVFSSEPGLARWVLERNKRMIVGDSIDVEPAHIYTFDLNKMATFTKTPIELRKPVYNPTNYREINQEYYDSFNGGANDDLLKDPKLVEDASDEIRKYGEVVLCHPDPLPNKPLDSAIIFDEKKSANFVLCRINGEPNTEVRLYGKYRNLVAWCNATMLQGHVVRSLIRGNNRKIYHLENITIHRQKTALTVIEGGKEAKVTNKQTAVEKQELTQRCDFCLQDTPKNKIISVLTSGENEQHLCPECFACFEEDTSKAIERWSDKFNHSKGVH